MATINLGAIKFNWKGAYNNSTAYAVDDVVSSGGNSYVCIQASQGNAVGNATAYWNIMSLAGTNGSNGSSGDTFGLANKEIAFKTNAGALDGIAIGTAGQALKVNSGATGYEFGAVAGGKVLQVVAVNKTDVFTTNSSNFTSVTGLNSGNITPASTSSKFLVTIHLGSFSNSGDNSRAFGVIIRNISGGADTTLHVGDASNGHEVGFALCARGNSGTHSQFPIAFQYLDSPNTTTAVNYRLAVTVGSDGGNIAINTAYSSTAERGNTASSITVQEISS